MSYAQQYRKAWSRGMATRGARWVHGVKWRGAAGLGSLDNAQTYGVGQQLVAGYNVQSSADAATKLQAVRDAMAYGFRGAIVSVGWGGPGAPGGVPAGQIYVVVRIGASGVTGQVMNTVFSSVGMNIQSRLPAGSTVTNTYASVYQGLVSGTTGGSTSASTSSGLLTSLFSPSTTPTAPTTTDTTLPTDLTTTAPQPFFMQEVGGVPVWVLGIGGVALLGGIAFVALRKPHAAPKVTANRRRRVRRNGWRRRASRALKGRRRSRSKRSAMLTNRRSRRSRRSGGYHGRGRRSVRANRRRRRARAGARRGETRARFVRRNSGEWEYGVHGNSKRVYNDPFSRMAKADYAALDKIYTSEVAAVRVANRLQRKYGHMIEFRVKSRPKSTGGFGQTIRYSHLDVAHPHRMRRARARLRKVHANSAVVTYRSKRYRRRAPRPGDVFYVAKPVGTVPLTSPLFKVLKSGAYEDTTTGTLYDPRIAGIKTAWVRSTR